jgi:hypothetical protein
MTDDAEIALQLAMERLRKTDAEAGLERQPVTDAQKAAVAQDPELRRIKDSMS